MLSNIAGKNFDLLSVGIAAAGIGLLGFAIYFSNRRSATNRAFLFFSLMTIVWGLSNYLEYKFTTVTSALYALRIHLFISVWHAYAFFRLSYIFPAEEKVFSKWHNYLVMPLVIVTSILTLTPFVFIRIDAMAVIGQVTNPVRGPGIILFAVVAFGLLGSGLIGLFRKTLRSRGLIRRQSVLVLSGMFFTTILILLFNVILPITFANLRFIPLGAIFIFPFIAFTAYAISRYNLLNIKVAGTAFVTFVLAVITFAEIIYADTPSLFIFRISIFILVLIFGINLIRGVLREVEQREKIQKLAEDLELANERQEGLIHFISHQIKGYLTKSKAAFSGILEGDYGEVSAVMREMVKLAIFDNDAGVETIRSILSASDLKKGTTTYKRESFDFKSLVEKEISINLRPAKAKGLDMDTFITPNENYSMIGDPEQLSKHVIGNLIDNSINYTLDGGLKIFLSKSKGKILFSVKDTGVGISEEDKKRLFTEGGRGKESTKVNVNSTGYGLFIAKQIVEAHKGRIWAESAGRGKGAAFFVELPGL